MECKQLLKSTQNKKSSNENEQKTEYIKLQSDEMNKYVIVCWMKLDHIQGKRQSEAGNPTLYFCAFDQAGMLYV